MLHVGIEPTLPNQSYNKTTPNMHSSRFASINFAELFHMFLLFISKLINIINIFINRWVWFQLLNQDFFFKANDAKVAKTSSGSDSSSSSFNFCDCYSIYFFDCFCFYFCSSLFFFSCFLLDFFSLFCFFFSGDFSLYFFNYFDGSGHCIYSSFERY